jgi:hypothetical protein
MQGIKKETNQKKKDAFTKQMMEYFNRAEEIQKEMTEKQEDTKKKSPLPKISTTAIPQSPLPKAAGRE